MSGLLPRLRGPSRCHVDRLTGLGLIVVKIPFFVLLEGPDCDRRAEDLMKRGTFEVYALPGSCYVPAHYGSGARPPQAWPEVETRISVKLRDAATDPQDRLRQSTGHQSTAQANVDGIFLLSSLRGLRQWLFNYKLRQSVPAYSRHSSSHRDIPQKGTHSTSNDQFPVVQTNDGSCQQLG